MGTCTTPITTHPTVARQRTERDLIGKLKSQLEHIDEKKLALAKTIESLEKLKFNIGDFVVHKKYGNCIITEYFVKESPENPDQALRCFTDQEAKHDFGYIIQSPIWDIYHSVSEEDLIEYNKTTKLLYNK